MANKRSAHDLQIIFSSLFFLVCFYSCNSWFYDTETRNSATLKWKIWQNKYGIRCLDAWALNLCGTTYTQLESIVSSASWNLRSLWVFNYTDHFVVVENMWDANETINKTIANWILIMETTIKDAHCVTFDHNVYGSFWEYVLMKDNEQKCFEKIRLYTNMIQITIMMIYFAIKFSVSFQLFFFGFMTCNVKCYDFNGLLEI